MGREIGERQNPALLMRAAQAGDSGACSELLRALLPLVKELVRQRYSFLQSQDIDDLVQDILPTVHAARATYDPTRPFLPWLRPIARYRMADNARRHALRTGNEVASGQPRETFAAKDANMSGNGYTGMPRPFREAMAKLRYGRRQAVELMKLHEMSLKEAGAITGSNIGALGRPRSSSERVAVVVHFTRFRAGVPCAQ